MGSRVAALLFLVLATPAVYAATHLVGGNNGWNTGVDYSTWANGVTCNVGDALDFKYDSSSHGVKVVSQDDYNNCNTGNALQSFTGGSNTVSLKSAGPMYFVCSNSFHCSQGMKLAVNVKDAGGSPPSGSPPTTPATPTTPSTPGSTTPTTPSTPDSPTPSTNPSTSSPTTRNSPNSPSGGTNAAAGSFGSINHLMLGFSLVLAAMAI